jgi:hypothetical protein
MTKFFLLIFWVAIGIAAFTIPKHIDANIISWLQKAYEKA